MVLKMAIEYIVFTDEMYVEFNSTRHQKNMTGKYGRDADQ